MDDDTTRQVWCDWFRRHGVDPHSVVVGNGPARGFVETDSDAYQIRYLAFDLNEHGDRYVDPESVGMWAAQSVHVVQLEARPSPFPT